jgi:hypothetical protein
MHHSPQVLMWADLRPFGQLGAMHACVHEWPWKRIVSHAGVARCSHSIHLPFCAEAGSASISWTEDSYGGAVVETASAVDPTDFSSALGKATTLWRAQNKRGIWLKLMTSQAALIPFAVQHGFDFHHAEAGHVMMTLWLPDEPSTLPPNASHQVRLFWGVEKAVGLNPALDPRRRLDACGNLLPLTTLGVQVGVGALVLNDKGEMLVVQERSGPLKGRAVW